MSKNVVTFSTSSEPISGMDLLSMLRCFATGDFYNPPISFDMLAKLFRMNSHHSSAIIYKRNQLSKSYIDNTVFPRREFEKSVQDELVFGNSFNEIVRNRNNEIVRIESVKAKYCRRGVKKGSFYYLANDNWLSEGSHQFKDGSIYHLMNPDINQDIYGLPEYLSAIISLLLNDDATKFRRRYYINGAHAGFILYMTDTLPDGDLAEEIETQLFETKGDGQFKNMFVYSPNGKKDGLQVLPLSDIAAKDEFANIKNISRDDVLAAHRVPPQLLGVIPTNTGGFGDIEKAASVFFDNEIEPLQARWLMLNQDLGQEIIKFKE